MEKENTIETLGFIKKNELVKTMTEEIIPNTFVMEALEPFPGYHGENLPGNVHPDFIFFMLKQTYRSHTIVRTTQNIKKYFSQEFNGEYGTLSFHNTTYPVIRIKNLKHFDSLAQLQSCFIDEGIEFLKPVMVKANSVLHIQKYFYLSPCTNCMNYFFDTKNPKISYFVIPKYMKWAQFQEVSLRVKNNMSNRDFDTAQAAFYWKSGIIELVRVYSEKQSLDYIKEIRKKYLEIIETLD